MFGPTVERLVEDSQNLQTDGQTDIAQTLADVQERYNLLQSTTAENIEKLQNSQSSRKQLEADILKIELWVKEAAGACSRDLTLDVPIEQLNEQLKKYQNLVNSGQAQEDSLKHLLADVEDLKAELSDSDLVEVKEEVAGLKERFERSWAEVQERLASLQETHSNR